MTYEITKQDNNGIETIQDGECGTYEEALEIYIDCVLDHGMDDSWLAEDYSRIRRGRNDIKYRKLLEWLRKNGCLHEDFLPMGVRDDKPVSLLPYTLTIAVKGDEDEDYDDYDLFKESWDSAFNDKPVNQYGEKWQALTDTYLNEAINDVIRDVQIEPYDTDPKLERLVLDSLHVCEDGHVVAEFYGGANGGGMRGEESNWKFYLALVRKFLEKLLDYNNGSVFKNVWLIDWSNDSLDDCWTMVLGIELTDMEKLQLLECGEKFSVVNPEKIGIVAAPPPACPVANAMATA